MADEILIPVKEVRELLRAGTWMETMPFEQRYRIEALRAASRIVAAAASNYTAYASDSKETLDLAKAFAEYLEHDDVGQ